MSEKKEKPVGRPQKFEDVKQMERKIKKYFKDCEGKLLKNKDGTYATDKRGNPIIVGKRKPTVSGLAIALGFTNRQSLLNYQNKDEFFDAITRAKGKIEMYTEEALYENSSCNGAKFSLSNNFGWSEKKSIDAKYTEKKLEDILKESEEQEES